MVRWHLYALAGAIAGAVAFFWLLQSEAAVLPCLAAALTTAGFESVGARRSSVAEKKARMWRVVVRAGLAFLFTAAAALGVFLLLFASQVAP